MKYDVWCLLFLCPNCSPSALTHLFNENVKLLTVDWFLWQAVPDHVQRFFVFGDWCGFWMELVIGLQHGAPGMVVHGSGATRGNWSFLVNSGTPPEATHFKFWTRNSAVANKPRDALVQMQRCVWPPALKGAGINTRQPLKLGSSETALSSGTEAWLIPFHNNNGPISYLE